MRKYVSFSAAVMSESDLTSASRPSQFSGMFLGMNLIVSAFLSSGLTSSSPRLRLTPLSLRRESAYVLIHPRK